MRQLDIEKTVNNLENIGVEVITHETGEFCDEPRFPHYATELKISPKLQKKYPGIRDRLIGDWGSGSSTKSPKEAIIKSIFEALERLCLKAYNPAFLKRDKFVNRPSHFIDPSLFSKWPGIKKQSISWLPTKRLIDGKDFFLPAQLVFLNRFKQEPLNFLRISTGAAAGINHEQALLNGIYEVVERDSTMSVYLNKITPPKVDLNRLNNKQTNSILDKCKRYKIDIHVADITTDTNLPSYVSVLIDRTGFGPAVSVGSKTSLRADEAIIGAIIESFMTRFSTRLRLKNGDIFGKNHLRGKDMFSERSAWWFPRMAIKDIEFMICGSYTNRKHKKFNDSIKEELRLAIKTIRNSKRDIYYSDISIGEIKKLGILIYKVIIPGLQPLYLRETEKGKFADIQRLTEVAEFFGTKYHGLNIVPHPFP